MGPSFRPDFLVETYPNNQPNRCILGREFCLKHDANLLRHMSKLQSDRAHSLPPMGEALRIEMRYWKLNRVERSPFCPLLGLGIDASMILSNASGTGEFHGSEDDSSSDS